ncbi:MAG TPA: hypothetical protein VF403_16700 [Kofleriaceae bacterium]
MTEPSRERSRGAPTWLRDGFGAMSHEAHSYLETTWALVRRPSKFAAEWFEGTRTAMNPLAMLATGATLVAATRQLGATVLDLPHPDSLIAAIASALGPYAHYIVLGLFFHLTMIMGRSRRDRSVRVTDTVALSLYAGAGPAALTESIGWLLLCALEPLGHGELMRSVMLGVAFTVFCFVLATVLGALHRPSPWRVVLAFVLAFPLTGLLFGYLDPPGSYGLHWVMHLSPFYLGLGM